MKPVRLVVLLFAAALSCAAAVAGCAAHSSTLGEDCGQSCAGSVCMSSGPEVDEVCGTSLLPAQCVGSGQQYCTKACASDSDCQPAPFEMRCLTVCVNQIEFQGVCWSVADWTSLSEGICR